MRAFLLLFIACAPEPAKEADTGVVDTGGRNLFNLGGENSYNNEIRITNCANTIW